ncbi:unnamed protein product [Dicrocoelium dendriticum]|nr:unnamed protein product [Dicrocoelium dendriticum]
MAIHPLAISSSRSFDDILSRCAEEHKILLADFYADWCAPCQRSAPHVQLLCEEFTSRGVVFVKINADQCKDLCLNEFVTGLPTFKLYRNRECQATIVGADLLKLRSLLEKYSLHPFTIQLGLCTDVVLKSHARDYLIKLLNDIASGQICQPLSVETGDLSLLIGKIKGFEDFLISIGLKKNGSVLELNAHALDKEFIRVLLDQLKALNTTDISTSATRPSDSSSATPTFQAEPSDTGQLRGAARIPFSARHNNDPLYTRLTSYRSTVVLYLDPEAQAMANSLIPTEELIAKAAHKSNCSPSDVIPRVFLRQLLRWFKEEFFRWADEFKCETCNSRMTACGFVTPNQTEREGAASSVELYKCTGDATHPSYRFPRLNDPKALLHTRLGRCGEWANCLALCLVSVRRPPEAGGQPWFPACRLVVCWTDHVWCEVWLEDEIHPGRYRWVHCDPGGEIDQPLLYESGWGKKLDYVFAYTVPPPVFDFDSPDSIHAVDVQDVVWRYTRNFSEILSRRTAVDEQTLTRYLTSMHLDAISLWDSQANDIRASLGDAHPFTLCHIWAELASFLTPPKAPEHRLPGRQTGSLEWRRARGELGADDGVALQPVWRGSNKPMVPTKSELAKGLFYLRYNSALDIYERPFASDEQSPTSKETEELVTYAVANGLKGWQSAAARWKNIDRKVEHDWHMIYLAREDDSSADQDGSIEWWLHVAEEDYEIGKVSLFANMACHSPEAAAHLLLCSGFSECDQSEERVGDLDTGRCVRFAPGSSPLFELVDFMGEKQLCLKGRLWTRELYGKNPSPLAWQHAQLFRQKDTDRAIWSLEWKVELVKKLPKQDEP